MDAGQVMYLIQTLMGVCGVVLWAMFNDVKSQSKTTQKELADYKVQVAKEYASREEVDRIIASFNKSIEQHTVIINDRFNRLENILDRVRDKS